MLKQILHGALFGTGFSVVFVAIYSAWMTWVLPGLLQQATVMQELPQTEQTAAVGHELSQAPGIDSTQRFLGTSGVYDGDFEPGGELLAAGEGEIVGKIRASGKGAEGVRLRLALNGSVMSQWAVTDEYGEYRIAVPAGRYRIDGYELDRRHADSVLAGLTGAGWNSHKGAMAFAVGADKPGEGLNLDYVVPVKTLAPKGEISVEEKIVARWEPYPGAERYRLQLYRGGPGSSPAATESLFTWRQRPEVQRTEFDLGNYRDLLRPGYYYRLEVCAVDKGGRVLAESAGRFGEMDFKLVE